MPALVQLFWGLGFQNSKSRIANMAISAYYYYYFKNRIIKINGNKTLEKFPPNPDLIVATFQECTLGTGLAHCKLTKEHYYRSNPS
jgi:hypothetical protein